MHQILIVEDDPIIRTLFRDVLQSQEYGAIEATNGLDGVNAAEKEAPTVILMNIQLLEMDGLQAVERFKSNPATHHIPMVALTKICGSGRP